jgi:hypothetical protein
MPSMNAVLAWAETGPPMREATARESRALSRTAPTAPSHQRPALGGQPPVIWRTLNCGKPKNWCITPATRCSRVTSTAPTG